MARGTQSFMIVQYAAGPDEGTPVSASWGAIAEIEWGYQRGFGEAVPVTAGMVPISRLRAKAILSDKVPKSDEYVEHVPLEGGLRDRTRATD